MKTKSLSTLLIGALTVFGLSHCAFADSMSVSDTQKATVLDRFQWQIETDEHSGDNHVNQKLPGGNVAWTLDLPAITLTDPFSSLPCGTLSDGTPCHWVEDSQQLSVFYGPKTEFVVEGIEQRSLDPNWPGGSKPAQVTWREQGPNFWATSGYGTTFPVTVTNGFLQSVTVKVHEDFKMLVPPAPNPATGSVLLFGGYNEDTRFKLAWLGTAEASATLTVSAHKEPIPEPSSMLLLGSGLLGATGMLRKRSKTNRN